MAHRGLKLKVTGQGQDAVGLISIEDSFFYVMCHGILCFSCNCCITDGFFVDAGYDGKMMMQACCLCCM